MSFYRLLLSAFVAKEYKETLTAPNLPPKRGELVETTIFDIERIRAYQLVVAQFGQVLFALAEGLVVTAAVFPSLRIPYFSSYLAPNSIHLRLTPWSLVGACLLACGSQIRKWTFRELGRFFRFEVSIQEDHKLIVTGPYAYVRHPSYTGMTIANIGLLLWTFSAGSWVRESGMLHTLAGKLAIGLHIGFGVFPSSVITLSRVHTEDGALRDRFGAQWEEWRERVPYAIFPGIY